MVKSVLSRALSGGLLLSACLWIMYPDAVPLMHLTWLLFVVRGVGLILRLNRLGLLRVSVGRIYDASSATPGLLVSKLDGLVVLIAVGAIVHHAFR